MLLRRTSRLREFSYIGPQAYFLTVCTHRRQKAFTIDSFAHDAREKLLRTAAAHGFALPAYCLMPDHVHLLAEGEREDSRLETFVRSWNTQTGFAWRRRHGGPLWQVGYYDHVLRGDESVLAVARYVVLNPVRAGLVMAPEEWPWTGSTRHTIGQILEAADDWRPTA
jgi:putative transposase